MRKPVCFGSALLQTDDLANFKSADRFHCAIHKIEHTLSEIILSHRIEQDRWLSTEIRTRNALNHGLQKDY